ncbi:hypothetical protein CHLNCDRAFT_50289 [Chlorella variabilis]|uniref:thioredoxin-dependent peroxiredoxin n=1 Tax=Chlorella variabilis TaxID=554065 RepID=E1Z5Q3_CHLVA|nr:hypothetical protein CHLNCDRAFT_50289 [Chlorella variabilis]EFN58795.1 hypothetical protein CHLNCDRAFT_50289 [Chlorella variabilis]|eukprot:XP_005850897.1 hypothetical protein CHLNCDRAFT_50289 [Chlorella variabilis]
MAPKRKSTDKTAAPEPAAKKGKAKSGTLAVGDTVPSSLLLREDDTEVQLLDLVKDKGIVVFMYPRANTGGCTKQACGFRDRVEEFTAAGFDVYGMSFDKPKSQLLKAFGALKAAKSILRSHVVIAKGGKLLDIKNGISPGDSYAEAADFCAKHKQK